MPQSLLKTLRDSVEGLLYQSESDEPFAVVHWPAIGGNLDEAAVRRLAGVGGGVITRIAESDFFEPLTRHEDWHGRSEKTDVKRYRHLHAWLRTNLESILIFRITGTEPSQYLIYIMGCLRIDQSQAMGIMTKSIET